MVNVADIRQRSMKPGIVIVEKGKTMKNRPEKLGKGVRFERIRRITGYLVGSLATWNNAKKAEERDRVKHSLGEKK